MDTPHNYTYSAHFVGHDLHGELVEGKSRYREGGEEGDLVTISPATFGEGGWMVYVNTDRASYEGVLIASLTFQTQSGVAESCTLSRPINIYVRGHSGPFEQDFVAMVPRENHALPWRCRDGLDCVITCPFVASGPVDVELTSVSSQAHLVSGVRREFWGEEWRLGEYYGKARFILPAFNSLMDAGTYLCTVSTESKSATADVVVN
nr:hypothetical protein BaRGS_023415 [Batillaria attramentaria]